MVASQGAGFMITRTRRSRLRISCNPLRLVILSGVRTSQSEVLVQSKDPLADGYNARPEKAFPPQPRRGERLYAPLLSLSCMGVLRLRVENRCAILNTPLRMT